MKLSEIARKELVDINEGAFWGPVGRADLHIDETTGEIKALLLIGRTGFLGFGHNEEVAIPWSSVIKVGKDTVIVDIPPQRSR